MLRSGRNQVNAIATGDMNNLQDHSWESDKAV